MGLFLCYKIINSVSVQKLGSGHWVLAVLCLSCAQQLWCQDRAMGLFSSQQVLERFTWCFFWGGLMVGFSLEDAQAEIHWEQRSLEEDPSIVLILAGEGLSALVV